MNNVRVRKAQLLEQHDVVKFGSDMATYRVEYSDDDDSDEVTSFIIYLP